MLKKKKIFSKDDRTRHIDEAMEYCQIITYMITTYVLLNHHRYINMQDLKKPKPMVSF